MGRLPFDPSKMAQPESPEPRVPAALTVSQLATQISAALSKGIADKVRVVGEVSGFRERIHWYFDLKDANAIVNCAMFAAAARKARFTPTNGQEVVVTGRIDFYDKQGRVTLIVERIEPVGAGAQDLALKALLEEIRKLGWLEESRKRPIPTFPRRVAIVTSRSGAALQDVLDTMRRRCPAVGIVLVDARVQGDGAAEEVAAAVRWLGASHERLQIDAILVTRGGGSKEDLWAFNEKIVAEAIVTCPIPVIAAIGHETDTTIAELVADLRCATPTQAAMRLTPDRAALTEQLDAMSQRMRAVLLRELKDARSRLNSAASRPCLADPNSTVDHERRHLESLAKALRQAGISRLRTASQRMERLAAHLEVHKPAAAHARRQTSLATVSTRLHAAIRTRLADSDLDALQFRLIRAWATANERAALRVESLNRQLTAIGPASVLKRGFSYTMRDDGVLVRSVTDARPGDILNTTVSDGQVKSVVGGVGGEPLIQPPAPRKPTRKPAPPDSSQPGPDQMDLFGGNR